MDQEKISGIGNIYANEALWLAKINPKKPANQLNNQLTNQLFAAILKVLKNGLKYGGASDQSYLQPSGEEGKYQEHFLVYGRQGQICPRCKKTKIQKISLGGRGTYICPSCQE
jgi:formamidopyrimidine-DNA glycosylase